MDISTPVEQKVYVRLSTKRRGPVVTIFKNELLMSGFTFNERKNYSSFYERLCPASEFNYWKQYAERNNLKFTFFEEKYARDNSYRKTFFEKNKPVSEPKYRCAYCGRKIPIDQTTVDHIFPVNKMCHDERVRRQAKSFGITETNEDKNLVACCKHCNSRKGTKTGLWIYRGLIGRNNNLWIFRKTLRYSILAIIIITAFIMLFQPTIQMPFSANQLRQVRYLKAF